ncbi:MAG: RES family NAD+ phosphorylase [Terriglobia bacterium]
MTITAWRIVQRKHAESAFGGEGARRFGGRWNRPGVPVVYASGSPSLAALEMLVHLEAAELLEGYVLFKIEVDERLVERLNRSRLPTNWREYPPPLEAQLMGDAWVAAGSSAVLEVPSATIPAERNFLLNPRHPDFPKLHIGKPHPFTFDPRLAHRL